MFHSNHIYDSFVVYEKMIVLRNSESLVHSETSEHLPMDKCKNFIRICISAAD